jgi:hypothetical protein
MECTWVPPKGAGARAVHVLGTLDGIGNETTRGDSARFESGAQ